MRKFKIEKVKPFNDLYFRSCYYHQLLAGLKAFDTDKDEVLLSFFTLIKKDFKVKEINFNDRKKFLKTRNYKIHLCNLNKEKIIKNLDNRYPVILGIDDFYLESKEETYLKIHEPHFLLVYGYDLDNNIFYVIEHDYRNDYNYKEKELSIDNVLFANEKFKYISKKKRVCKVLIPSKQKRNINFKYIKHKYLIKSHNNSLKNLNKLKEILLDNLYQILEYSDILSNYFGKLKEQYHLLTQTNLICDNVQLTEKINKVIINYSMILSVLWKTNYLKNISFIEKNITTIINKIYEVILLEKEIYKELLNVFKH